MIARQRELVGKVLPAHADAAKKGQIEISASPFYHPILPLVCDTNMWARSLRRDCRCRKIAFAILKMRESKLMRGLDLHEKVFGDTSAGHVALRGQRFRGSDWTSRHASA